MCDEGTLFIRIECTSTYELTIGKISVGIFANGISNLRVLALAKVSVKFRWGENGIDEDYGAELAACAPRAIGARLLGFDADA